jgi:hypothetical protein
MKIFLFVLAIYAIGVSRPLEVKAVTTYYVYGNKDTILVPYNLQFGIAVVRTGGYGIDTVFATLSGSSKIAFAIDGTTNKSDSVAIWIPAMDSAGYRDSIRSIYMNFASIVDDTSYATLILHDHIRSDTIYIVAIGHFILQHPDFTEPDFNNVEYPDTVCYDIAVKNTNPVPMRFYKLWDSAWTPGWSWSGVRSGSFDLAPGDSTVQTLCWAPPRDFRDIGAAEINIDFSDTNGNFHRKGAEHYDAWPNTCVTSLVDTPVVVSDVMVGGYVDASLKFIMRRDSIIGLRSITADSASVTLLSPTFPKAVHYGDTIPVRFRITPQYVANYTGAIKLSDAECQPVFRFRGRAVHDGEDSLSIFGDQSALLTLRADSVSISRTFFFHNSMPSAIRVTDVHITNGAHFHIDSIRPHDMPTPDTLASGADLPVYMTFDADTLGFYRDSLIVVTEGSLQASRFNLQAIMAKTRHILPQKDVALSAASRDLFSLYPNPTHSKITIGIAGASRTAIEVFDLLGKRVTALSVIGELTWDASVLPRGTYIVRATGSDGRGVPFVISKRLVVE